MDSQSVRSWIENEGEFSFSRSAGPGGQNVNKLNTKVTLSLDLSRVPGLSESELALLQKKLQSRISGEQKLVLQVQDTRSQGRNREIAVLRAMEIIALALVKRKKRKPTRPTASSKTRRLDKKKQRGSIKKSRKNPGPDSW